VLGTGCAVPVMLLSSAMFVFSGACLRVWLAVGVLVFLFEGLPFVSLLQVFLMLVFVQ
jgi:hypothetical protein